MILRYKEFAEGVRISYSTKRHESARRSTDLITFCEPPRRVMESSDCETVLTSLRCRCMKSGVQDLDNTILVIVCLLLPCRRDMTEIESRYDRNRVKTENPYAGVTLSRFRLAMDTRTLNF